MRGVAVRGATRLVGRHQLAVAQLPIGSQLGRESPEEPQHRLLRLGRGGVS